MAKYYDGFTDYASLPYAGQIPPEDDIVYAGYTYEDYTGSALIVFTKDGEWWENNDGHCSCYGLEEWAPEKTSREALLMRQGWPGLHEALDERPAAAAVDPHGDSNTGNPVTRDEKPTTE